MKVFVSYKLWEVTASAPAEAEIPRPGQPVSIGEDRGDQLGRDVYVYAHHRRGGDRIQRCRLLWLCTGRERKTGGIRQEEME